MYTYGGGGGSSSSSSSSSSSVVAPDLHSISELCPST
jgi:hypothetical protein